MERKSFIKTVLATATLSVINPFTVFDLFEEEKDIMLPFIGGMQRITLLKHKASLVSDLTAQSAYYSPYAYQQSYHYSHMAPYDQWYAYQQAVAYWNQQLLVWQQQQQYNSWLQQSHIQRMQYLLSQYQGSQKIGQPSLAPTVQSIYGFAKDSNERPTLFGLNSQQTPVEIKDTVPGTAKIAEVVTEAYGEQEAEVAVLPQSSEGKALMTLPNNSMLNAKYFKTARGTVGVTDPGQPVVAANGRVGQLGKFVTKDGEQYMVI